MVVREQFDELPARHPFQNHPLRTEASGNIVKGAVHKDNILIGCFHLCHASFLNGDVRSRIDRGEQRTHGDSWLFPHLNP